MQKTTTLKDFKVLVLKTVLSILVLGISFQVSFAQEVQRTKGQPVVTPFMKKQQNAVITPVYATDVPAINQRAIANNPVSHNISNATNSFSRNPVASINLPGIPPTSNIVQDVCVFNGGLVAGDLTMTAGRPFRDGVAMACGVPKACAGASGTGPYYYDVYTMQNLTCQAQCVTVNYVANAGGGDVFVSTYLGSFNPLSLCTNRIADGGSSSLSGGASVTFSFNVAVNATVVFIVNGAQINTACPSYTMTVTGLNCTPPPPCTGAPTTSVLSQMQIPGPTVNLINEGFTTVVPAGWFAQNNSVPIGSFPNWFRL